MRRSIARHFLHAAKYRKKTLVGKKCSPPLSDFRNFNILAAVCSESFFVSSECTPEIASLAGVIGERARTAIDQAIAESWRPAVRSIKTAAASRKSPNAAAYRLRPFPARSSGWSWRRRRRFSGSAGAPRMILKCTSYEAGKGS